MTIDKTKTLYKILLHPVLGYLIFLFVMWLTFFCTFQLGNYFMEFMEAGVDALGTFAYENIPKGFFNDLVVQGIIGGVGGVIVFLPNIVILFTFISLITETGYMTIVAQLMDRVMHVIGLHGKSFIPLIMGFGCNVPAILSTKIIEDKRDRLITMLIIPFMSCSARLPVYIIIAGTFFPENATLVIFCLYLFGIILAMLFALLFKKTFNNANHRPYTVTMPEFHKPKLSTVIRTICFNAGAYLKKMGGIVLIASVLLWAMMYLPQKDTTKIENSYIASLGKIIEPVMEPIGFDWKLSVSLMTGVAAKEIIISTLGVLYSDNPETSQDILEKKLKAATHPQNDTEISKPVFTKPVALSFLIFTLIYFPCTGVFAAVGKESKWKWAVFVVTYTTVAAWILSFATYHIANIIFQ
ncbi:MAG TPA: ferrous iron transport protein B [Candidatus Onthomorpha intestinigallinarum]|uniref:Ferrous iron transport protein B n=1 Tax=Candidatus Onthomorpha intestinigallinarum TaxID=2840880 RepID=A0A9D1UH40_9BACT|nr:ferrous iron transport protein B [Candidatus Onthomorpha intestinigallinarum]